MNKMEKYELAKKRGYGGQLAKRPTEEKSFAQHTKREENISSDEFSESFNLMIICLFDKYSILITLIRFKRKVSC